MSNYQRINHQEEYKYMFVKVLGQIPYFEDSSTGGVSTPQDGKTYFEVISSHFLKGMILRMDEKDFDKRFTNERSRINSTNRERDKENIFSSREWLFYDKFKWWNDNIKAILDCAHRDSIEFASLYNDYSDKYCKKYNVGVVEFIVDKTFFDDLLSEVFVDVNGAVRTKKCRVGKPKRRKYCSACGNSAKFYINLPNGKVLCKMCEEQMEMWEFLKFEKQWEEDSGT